MIKVRHIIWDEENVLKLVMVVQLGEYTKDRLY